mgnify:CR=1 FL=1
MYLDGERKVKLKINKIKTAIRYCLEIVKCYLLYPVSILLYGRRNIYLFSERGTDARDNGLYLFRYYRREHPEINAYYVISDESADIDNVKEYGNIVQYKSINHYLLFLASTYKISTHIMGFSPNMDFYSRYFRFIPIRGKIIFLQHGITKNNLPQLYYENTKLDLFICGAYPEWQYINDNFGYPDHVVRYTGLARFDGLFDNCVKKQVLIMPTWRMYLKYNMPKNFEESEYYQCWNEILQSPDLEKWAIEHNFRIVFYPHHEFQKYTHLFETSSSSIVIADSAHYDVQSLLKESMLLITDYSSVDFDFAYMSKPVLYYQFDRDASFSNHYAKGYFDYDKDAFGDVAFSKNELLNYLEKWSKLGFVTEKKYLERINRFFPLQDKKNCERIILCIEEIGSKENEKQ